MLRGRLLGILDEIRPCGCLADIGTDHGYIPIYAVKKGIAQTALAVDIKTGPVIVARKNIEKHQLQESIGTLVSDGFKELRNVHFDSVVIAGMGGTLIADIMNEGFALLKKCKQIVVQPMNDIEECRGWLLDQSFEITAENIVEDGGRIYVIISARLNTACQNQYDETDILAGPCLKEGKHPLFIRYIDLLLKRRMDMLDDMQWRKVDYRSRDGINLDAFVKKTEREITILEGMRNHGNKSQRNLSNNGNGDASGDRV